MLIPNAVVDTELSLNLASVEDPNYMVVCCCMFCMPTVYAQSDPHELFYPPEELVLTR